MLLTHVLEAASHVAWHDDWHDVSVGQVRVAKYTASATAATSSKHSTASPVQTSTGFFRKFRDFCVEWLTWLAWLAWWSMRGRDMMSFGRLLNLVFLKSVFYTVCANSHV
jgi:hypothetical protein